MTGLGLGLGLTNNVPSSGGGAVEWSIENATYVQNFSVSSQSTQPADVWLSADGTKMMLLSNNNDRVFQYTLSTAFDISTASYDSKFFDTATQENNPRGISFNTDEDKMFIGGLGADAVFRYSASISDISTSTYDSNTVSIITDTPTCIAAKLLNSGSSLYTIDNTNGVEWYTLSTPYDLSTATHSGSLATSGQNTSPQSVIVSPTGLKMFVLGNSTSGGKVKGVYPYTLSTAWDVTTATYDGDGNVFGTAAQDSTMVGIHINAAGTKMYLTGTQFDDVYEYNL